MTTNRTSSAFEELAEAITLFSDRCKYKIASPEKEEKRRLYAARFDDMLDQIPAFAEKYQRMEEAFQKLATTEPTGYYYSCETVDQIVQEALSFDPLAS